MSTDTTRAPFARERLFCPGPTPVPAIARMAAMNESVYHRSETFTTLIQASRKLLGELIGCRIPPVILTCSGTGAMESAVINFTAPGSQTLVVNGGNFGERWLQLNQAYNCNVHSLDIPWGSAPNPQQIVDKLQTLPECSAFFIQANETSTGVYYPIKEIASAVRSTNKKILIVVDCISSLVAHEMRMDDWDIDVVVGGSQKGFGVPPGLAFVAISDRARNQFSNRPRFYFDLKREEAGQSKGDTAWTPAVTLVQALNASMQYLKQIGFSKLNEHHAKGAKAVREAGQAIGLDLFANGNYSNALTAFRLPSEAKGLVKTLDARFGAIFAGGQGQLSGQIFRFSHLGFVDQLDIIGGIGAVELGLFQATGRDVLGKGVAAASRIFAT